MSYNLLISTEELALHLTDPDWLVADCRFLLSKPDEKESDYQRAHIPGAIYVHLDRDLSAPVVPGVTGRHPLPAPADAARRFGALGIGPGVQVVAYDDLGGSLAAVRLWLMLRWLGHENAAILDGGWQKWLAEDRPVEAGTIKRSAREFAAQPPLDCFVTTDEVERIRLDPNFRLLDGRAPERFRGEVEPIDPIAGHIPGAGNIPYTDNLATDGTFKSPEELRQLYENLTEGVPAERVVFYCGSGVTSIHNMLAMKLAGLGDAKVYAGSWSEWITDSQRQIATGANDD